MEKMLKFFAAIGVVCSVANVADAAAREVIAVADYERFCIQGVFQHEHLYAMMHSLNAITLPPIAATDYLHQSGQVWMPKGLPYHLLVFLTDTGACGVIVWNVDYSGVQTAFKKRFPARFVERDDDDAQTLTIYAAHAPADAKAPNTRIFGLFLGGKGGARNKVVMSVIPKAALEKAGGISWKWPEQF